MRETDGNLGIDLGGEEEAEAGVGLQRVQLLLQLDQPLRRQVHVLEHDPATRLDGRVDGLLGLAEAFGRTDGDARDLPVQLRGQVVDATRSVETGRAAQKHRTARLDLSIKPSGHQHENTVAAGQPEGQVDVLHLGLDPSFMGWAFDVPACRRWWPGRARARRPA